MIDNFYLLRITSQELQPMRVQYWSHDTDRHIYAFS